MVKRRKVTTTAIVVCLLGCFSVLTQPVFAEEGGANTDASKLAIEARKKSNLFKKKRRMEAAKETTGSETAKAPATSAAADTTSGTKM